MRVALAEGLAAMTVRRIAAEAGETITLQDSVLLLSDDSKITVGTPTVAGAVVVIVAGLYNLHRERVRRAAEKRAG